MKLQAVRVSYLDTAHSELRLDQHKYSTPIRCVEGEPFGIEVASSFGTYDHPEFKTIQQLLNFTDNYYRSGTLHIIVMPEIPITDKKYLGYTFSEWVYDTENPVIALSSNQLRKFGPFKYLMARWVLQHELGHFCGLMHHRGITCLMSSPNISFGHFCKNCVKALRSS